MLRHHVILQVDIDISQEIFATFFKVEMSTVLSPNP
jgi:hypothetical protein